MVGSVVQADATAQLPYQRLDPRQAQAGAGLRIARYPVKALEHTPQFNLRKTGSLIPDLNLCFRVTGRGAQFDMAARRGVAQCVIQKIAANEDEIPWSTSNRGVSVSPDFKKQLSG
jgi:hypothetical protein